MEYPIKLPFETELKLRFPGFVKELKFLNDRKYRFDYAWLAEKVSLEYEGGVYTGGAHVRGKHYESDCEKYSLAATEGWCVIRVTNGMVKNGLAWELLEKAFGRKAD